MKVWATPVSLAGGGTNLAQAYGPQGEYPGFVGLELRGPRDGVNGMSPMTTHEARALARTLMMAADAAEGKGDADKEENE